MNESLFNIRIEQIGNHDCYRIVGDNKNGDKEYFIGTHYGSPYFVTQQFLRGRTRQYKKYSIAERAYKKIIGSIGLKDRERRES